MNLINFKNVCFIGCLFSFSLFACVETSKDSKSEKKEKIDLGIEESSRGELLFKKNCVLCHGAKGNMGASGAFDLTKTELTIPEKMLVIAKGRNTMTPFAKILSADEIKLVAEYTEKFKSDK